MIQPVNVNKNNRYNVIKYSGYTTIAGVGLATITGIKQLKLANKPVYHKAGAIISVLSIILHLGAMKNWDKIFQKQTKNNS